MLDCLIAEIITFIPLTCVSPCESRQVWTSASLVVSVLLLPVIFVFCWSWGDVSLICSCSINLTAYKVVKWSLTRSWPDTFLTSELRGCVYLFFFFFQLRNFHPLHALIGRVTSQVVKVEVMQQWVFVGAKSPRSAWCFRCTGVFTAYRCVFGWHGRECRWSWSLSWTKYFSVLTDYFSIYISKLSYGCQDLLEIFWKLSNVNWRSVSSLFSLKHGCIAIFQVVLSRWVGLGNHRCPCSTRNNEQGLCLCPNTVLCRWSLLLWMSSYYLPAEGDHHCCYYIISISTPEC